MNNLIKSILDYFGFCNHSWGKWEYSGTSGYEEYQRRICSKCGKEKQRSVGWQVH